MGYLNKATITVDAILTNRGRELLATQGQAGLQITKFAIADDEVDYGLYNDTIAGGSPYYGALIENMPVLEATPDEQQIMRYKLVSLDNADGLGIAANATNPFIVNGQVIAPTIINFDDVTLNSTTRFLDRSPRTNPTSFTESYTLIVANASLFTLKRGQQILNTSTAINANNSITVTIPENGSITFERKDPAVTGKTTATVFGNSTGATSTIVIDVS